MGGTGMFARIYEVVKAIPAGCVASYGQVAALAGYPRSARFVGFALHDNPEPGLTPCHRVVFKDGRICEGFAFGGPHVQRELLQAEGVLFADDTHVDMARCQWQCFEPEELEVVTRAFR